MAFDLPGDRRGMLQGGGALLAGLIALGAAGSMIASPAADARWSQWAALLLMAPCAYLAPRVLRTPAEAVH